MVIFSGQINVGKMGFSIKVCLILRDRSETAMRALFVVINQTGDIAKIGAFVTMIYSSFRKILVSASPGWVSLI
jgi:hypothetical protein